MLLLVKMGIELGSCSSWGNFATSLQSTFCVSVLQGRDGGQKGETQSLNSIEDCLFAFYVCSFYTGIKQTNLLIANRVISIQHRVNIETDYLGSYYKLPIRSCLAYIIRNHYKRGYTVIV